MGAAQATVTIAEGSIGTTRRTSSPREPSERDVICSVRMMAAIYAPKHATNMTYSNCELRRPLKQPAPLRVHRDVGNY